MCFRELLGGLGELAHDGLEVGSFGVVGPCGGFAGGRFGSTKELSIGGEHGFVVGGIGCLGGRSVRGEGLLAKEGELTEVENLERGVKAGF